MIANFDSIIRQYKNDSESVYNTWFINNEDRLKAFRSIRRGVMQVIDALCKFGESHHILKKIAKTVE